MSDEPWKEGEWESAGFPLALEREDETGETRMTVAVKPPDGLLTANMTSEQALRTILLKPVDYEWLDMQAMTDNERWDVVASCLQEWGYDMKEEQ